MTAHMPFIGWIIVSELVVLGFLALLIWRWRRSQRRWARWVFGVLLLLFAPPCLYAATRLAYEGYVRDQLDRQWRDVLNHYGIRSVARMELEKRARQIWGVKEVHLQPDGRFWVVLFVDWGKSPLTKWHVFFSESNREQDYFSAPKGNLNFTTIDRSVRPLGEGGGASNPDAPDQKSEGECIETNAACEQMK